MSSLLSPVHMNHWLAPAITAIVGLKVSIRNPGMAFISSAIPTGKYNRPGIKTYFVHDDGAIKICMTCTRVKSININ